MKEKNTERKMLRTDWKELPIDKELSEILLQLTNARARLLNFFESIPDRKTYEWFGDRVNKADDCILNAMNICADLLGSASLESLTKDE